MLSEGVYVITKQEGCESCSVRMPTVCVIFWRREEPRYVVGPSPEWLCGSSVCNANQ
jgi:hypothetical protein